MTYVKPEDVTAPQQSWQLERVLLDEGAGPGTVAIALGRWEGELRTAIRWNGYDKPAKGLGHPSSSGHATWFMLPPWLNDAVVEETAKQIKTRLRG